MALPQVIITGNLVADPELKYTAQGIARATFRVAASERKKDDSGKWIDGDTTFLTVTAWRQLAETVADSLQKGTSVIVSGRLRSRTVDSKDGQSKTTYFDVDADDIAISLRRGAVKTVARTPIDDDPWATPVKDEFPF